MTKHLFPLLVAGLAFSPFPSAHAADAKGSLTVDMTQIDTAQGGELLVMLYQTEDDWLQLGQEVQGKTVPVNGAQMRVEFTDIPYGSYAVSVIQDLNGNKKVDMSWLPIPRPKEPAGVSNNADAVMGPPSFEDARFTLNQPNLKLNITVEL